MSVDPLAAHRTGVRVLRRHAGNEGGMPGMPDLLAWACGVCRQALARDSRRNASDSFGGGSGMPVLPPCPASLASAHAGGDTRAPPGPGATPGISAPCMPGHCHCRAHHLHAANRLPRFLLIHSATLFTRIYCRMVIVVQGGQFHQ